MIFVTVGTQLPFPRLVDALDRIAGRHRLEVKGQTGEGDTNPIHINHQTRLSAAEFEAAVTGSSLIVAHAGIGVLIAAVQHRRPLIMMPRRADLGEHRNDHQIATARRFADMPGVMIAEDEETLERLILSGPYPAPSDTGSERRRALIAALATAIHHASAPAAKVGIPVSPVRSLPAVTPNRIAFAGLRFDRLSTRQVVDAIASRDPGSTFGYLTTPNVDHVVRLHERFDITELATAYDNAELCVCDSRVLSRLAQIGGVELPVAPGSDVTELLLRHHLPEGAHLLLIGGREDTLAKLRPLCPHATFEQHIPPMGLLENATAMTACVDRIIAERAQYVLLAVGSPQQELIAFRAQQTGRAIGMGLCIGASIDFLTGAARRAPAWMQRASLEWLHRLLTNPRRMWRRYLVRGPRILRIVARRS